jgi:uncharacterized SAM-binding protein YcdF (DUF218 family)
VIARLLLLIVVGWALGFAAFGFSLPGPADGKVTDAVVVVTGGPGRIQRGLRLIAAKRAQRMLIAGVNRRVRPHELAIEYRVPQALVACCVDLGRESVDTRSNGDEIAAWVRRRGYRSVRLVTTDWHMPRAALELRHSLPDDVVVVGDAVKSDPNFGMLLMEYNKFLVRRVAILVGL